MTNEPRTSKHPELHKSPPPASVPFELPEPTGDYLLGDQYAAKDIAELADSELVLEGLKRAHARYRDGFQKLRQAMQARDPNETEAKHVTESKTVADKWLKQAGQQADQAAERAKLALNRIRSDIQDQCQLDETPRAAEIRSMLRGLKPTERTELVSNAIRDGDAEILGAILHGSPVLTGFDEQTRQSFKQAYVRTHAPDLLKREQVIEKALEINFRTSVEALENYSKIFDQQRMAGISQAQAKSKAARAAVLED